MKPHIKVIQRNGVDIFVTSSMEMKPRFKTVNVLEEFDKWRNSRLAGLKLPTHNPYQIGCINQGVSATLGDRFFGG